MIRALFISVRFHDGRYHGAGDWPPAPARLFQALVAAAAQPSLDSARAALQWLEKLDAPAIAAPPKHEGQHVSLFVPNNDLDAKGGDIRRVAEIRSATKKIKPRLFDASVPLLYVWRFDAEKDKGQTHAECICNIADSLYQLGRGVDMAWAVAEVLDDANSEKCLAGYRGVIYRPFKGGPGMTLDCPENGSLKSLEDRYAANTKRFRRVGNKTEFANTPKPRFRPVAYNSPATHLLFDLRRTTNSGSPLVPWPLKQATVLVQKLRDGAVAKLTRQSLTKYFDAGTVSKVLIGRDAKEADKALRIRIVPIPSIGSMHVDRGIRRVLVEVPPNCPLRADDVAWAFAGLVIESHGIDVETGEITEQDNYWMDQLVAAEDDSMLEHYGLPESRGYRLWRSVTPLALPDSAKRRRIDPAKLKEEAKSGKERQAENRNAIHAIAQTLRHAGLRHCIANVHVQREPFEAGGEKAEAFADGTRFSKHQLWHVEIEFAESIAGPLIVGDGRYLGLGLMAPVKMRNRSFNPSYARYILNGQYLPSLEEAVLVGEWLRAGLMGKAKRLLGENRLPRILSGHDMPNNNKHEHAFYLPEDADGDGHIDHVTVYAKSGFDKDTYRVLNSMTRLWTREGREWQLILEDMGQRERMRAYTPLLGESGTWISVTPYLHPWFAKKNLTVEDQIKKECRMRGLPEPTVLERLESITINGRERTPLHFHRFRSKRGLTQPDTHGSFWKLTFPKPIPGPLALGFGCHYGLGMFKAEQE